MRDKPEIVKKLNLLMVYASVKPILEEFTQYLDTIRSMFKSNHEGSLKCQSNTMSRT